MNKEVEEYIEKQKSPQKEICKKLRKIILKTFPDTKEEMKLHGMLRAFNQSLEAGMMGKFTTDELLGHLVDAEWDDRYNRWLQRLIKAAKFRYQTSSAIIPPFTSWNFLFREGIISPRGVNFQWR